MNPEKMLFDLRQEMEIRGYSAKTVKVYRRGVELFLKECWEWPKKNPRERMKDFLWGLRGEEQRRIYYQGIRLFYRLVLRKPCPYVMDKSRRKKRKPQVLSKREVLRILGVIKNRRHRLMMALIYGAGLRVGEAVKLKVGDLDWERRSVWIRQGKNRKDRETLLPVDLEGPLRRLCRGRSSGEPLFVSSRDKAYSVRSLQMIMDKAVREAKITKAASCHSLRHSFATHSIENGFRPEVLKEVMGHKQLRTTLGYIHLADSAAARMKSPLEGGDFFSGEDWD